MHLSTFVQLRSAAICFILLITCSYSLEAIAAPGFVRNSGQAEFNDRQQAPLVDTTQQDWLYQEALKWDKINPQYAMDTMRLFILRHPYFEPLLVNAINYTIDFASEMAQYDSAGQTFVDRSVWIEEYNWLASVYSNDTTKYFHIHLIADMASSEWYFDRNGEANLWYNFARVFPDSVDVGLAQSEIDAIRAYQKRIPEDTTAFYTIPIPPLPYGVSSVAEGGSAASDVSLRVNPNPVSGTFTVSVDMPFTSSYSLGIYDELGREVKALGNAIFTAGVNSLKLDCSEIPSGEYYLRLATASKVKTIRLVIQH